MYSCIIGGLETETEYAYKGEDEKCLFNKTEVKVFINDSVSISSDEDGKIWICFIYCTTFILLFGLAEVGI